MSDGTNRATLEGLGLNFGLALGGTIAENLILYGEAYVILVDNPDRTTSQGSDSLTGVEMAAVNVGPGLAYYLEPLNAVLSLTVSFAKVDLEDDSTNWEKTSTKWGYGVSGLLGKEFWISSNWALGLALQVTTPAWPTTPRSRRRGCTPTLSHFCSRPPSIEPAELAAKVAARTEASVDQRRDQRPLGELIDFILDAVVVEVNRNQRGSP